MEGEDFSPFWAGPPTNGAFTMTKAELLKEADRLDAEAAKHERFAEHVGYNNLKMHHDHMEEAKALRGRAAILRTQANLPETNQ